MKTKVLLTVGLMLTASMGFAQTSFKPNLTFRQGTTIDLSKSVLTGKEAKAQTMRRSASTGVYYHVPEGTTFQSYNETGLAAWSVSILVTPPFYPVTFYNMSDSPTECTWTIGSNDYTQYADEEGNFPYGYLPPYNGYYYTAPVVNYNGTSYSFGYDNDDTGNRETAPSYNACIMADSITNVSFWNGRVGYTYFGWGFLSSHYLFGSGNYVDSENNTYPAIGWAQMLPAPVSPLWVENIHAQVLSFSQQPIPSGTTITMTVYPVNMEDTTINQDSVIATLTATADDYTANTGSNASYDSDYGTVYFGNLVFTQKESDPLTGADVTVPFTINGPVCVMLTGLDQTGVDLGFQGHILADEDNYMPERGLVLVSTSDGTGNLGYRSFIVPDFAFKGFYDYVEAADTLQSTDTEGNTTEYADCNVIKVSADGQTYTNAAMSDLTGAIVYTALPWLDGDGNPNYTAEYPEWITSVEGDDSNRGTGADVTGMEVVNVTCDALPSGTTGRAASVWITGRGYTSPTPVIVLQGDATIADAISQIKTDKNAVNNNAVYNLAGQRVNKTTKGIVIMNGKKYMMK